MKVFKIDGDNVTCGWFVNRVVKYIVSDEPLTTEEWVAKYAAEIAPDPQDDSVS
jgi:hypothetical protein